MKISYNFFIEVCDKSITLFTARLLFTALFIYDSAVKSKCEIILFLGNYN